jgi:hypothetical protein
MAIDSLICGLDLMRPMGFPASNRGRTRLNGQLRFDRAGAAAAPWPASPDFHSRHYGARRLGFSRSKRSGGQGDPYPGVLDGGLVS